jgi:hypothetical protein
MKAYWHKQNEWFTAHAGEDTIAKNAQADKSIGAASCIECGSKELPP